MPEFQWDRGNWPKCGKHGLSKADIESVFEADVFVFDDPHPTAIETRHRAIGVTSAGRHAFIVFTMRTRNRTVFIRPLSARYMHKKEVDHYERQKRS